MDTVFTGRIWKLPDDVDTDTIIPGRYGVLPSAEEMSRHCLEPLRPELVMHSLPHSTNTHQLFINHQHNSNKSNQNEKKRRELSVTESQSLFDEVDILSPPLLPCFLF